MENRILLDDKNIACFASIDRHIVPVINLELVRNNLPLYRTVWTLGYQLQVFSYCTVQIVRTDLATRVMPLNCHLTSMEFCNDITHLGNSQALNLLSSNGESSSEEIRLWHNLSYLAK